MDLIISYGMSHLYGFAYIIIGVVPQNVNFFNWGFPDGVP